MCLERVHSTELVSLIDDTEAPRDTSAASAQWWGRHVQQFLEFTVCSLRPSVTADTLEWDSVHDLQHKPTDYTCVARRKVGELDGHVRLRVDFVDDDGRVVARNEPDWIEYPCVLCTLRSK